MKIGYNKVFGYYIDVTKTHLDKVPDNYIRKQTLTNSERYFTEELKDYEVKILSSNDKIIKVIILPLFLCDSVIFYKLYFLNFLLVLADCQFLFVKILFFDLLPRPVLFHIEVAL